MKSLKQYLTESINEKRIVDYSEKLDKLISRRNDNTVFHFTSIDGAKGIMQSNEMWVSDGKIDRRGLSTTYSPSYSRGQCDVCFHLDFEKLCKDFDHIFVDEQLGEDEYEVKFLSDDSISKISKYTKAISTESECEELKEAISTYCEKYDIVFYPNQYSV